MQPFRERYNKRVRFNRFRHFREQTLIFLRAQVARLISTQTLQTFTANSTTDVLTANGHGFTTGRGPVQVSNSGGALPAGLSANTDYWPIRVDANTFRLATTRLRAIGGTAIDITTNGTGTNSIAVRCTNSALHAKLRYGVKPRTLTAASDIDSAAI